MTKTLKNLIESYQKGYKETYELFDFKLFK